MIIQVNVLFNGGFFHGRIAEVTGEDLKADSVITIDTPKGKLKYRLRDGPALQAAIISGSSHPNLACNATYEE